MRLLPGSIKKARLVVPASARRRARPTASALGCPYRLVNFAFGGRRTLNRSGPVSKHKAGDFEVQNCEFPVTSFNLNNRAAGKGSVKTIDLCDQKTAPIDA